MKVSDLHSNMVRFIIRKARKTIIKNIGFTFQYGQIYYSLAFVSLLSMFQYLHSNMVRFIMKELLKINAEQKMIYIPIWLDLL